MKKLLVVGASGHGKVLANIAYDCGKWDEISFLDDNADIFEQKVLHFTVIDTVSNAHYYVDEYEFVVGIGDAHVREKITKGLETMNVKFATLIHPSATIGINVKIGKGTVVMPKCVVNASTIIEEGCIINTGTIIDHDCKIKSFSHLSPGVSISGTVKIGCRTWIGAGATVINNVKITSDIIVGAGAVVIKNLSVPGVYFGSPAKLIRERGNFYVQHS